MSPTIFEALPIAPLLALALTVVPLTRAATTETLTSPTLEIAVSQTGGTTFSDNLTKRSKSQRMAQNTRRIRPHLRRSGTKTHDSLPGWHKADVARRRKPVRIRME